MPDSVHGRSFVECVHDATGARVAFDALHALRGWAELSAARDALGGFETCERSAFWAREEAAAAKALEDGEDARVKPAQVSLRPRLFLSAVETDRTGPRARARAGLGLDVRDGVRRRSGRGRRRRV